MAVAADPAWELTLYRSCADTSAVGQEAQSCMMASADGSWCHRLTNSIPLIADRQHRVDGYRLGNRAAKSGSIGPLLRG